MKKIISQLSPIEKKILPHIAGNTTIQALAKKLSIPIIEALRACQFLENKQLVTLEKTEKEEYILTARGEHARKQGLPEQILYNTIPKEIELKNIEQATSLDRSEIHASLGALKKQESIEIENGLIRKTTKKPVFPELTEPNKHKEFVKRGLLEIKNEIIYTVHITALGKKAQEQNLEEEYIEELTSEMLKERAWKQKSFRAYDVTSTIPSRVGGRKHFVQEAIEAIKQIWVEMGFKEMKGTTAQTAYWDLDALYVPQDHPAREMQDTFYLNQKGKLPKHWERVKEIHENGGQTGSTGWKATYNTTEAEKVLLRTHTTVLSARTLAQLTKKDLPAKFFSVAKVYRNETLDWKHLFEFHQVEGIVVGEGLGLKDLIGLQREFYKKMGYTDVRFRPAYFPYTEPSCEVEAYNPKKKQWVELGGMGVFRPEVVIPLLGEDIPVLAWGLGMERIITAYYDIQDLRELYTNDLKQLRNAKIYLEEE